MKIQRWKHIAVAKYAHDSDTGWCESEDVAKLEDEIERLHKLEAAVGEFVNATGDDKKQKLSTLIAVYDEASAGTEAA